MITSDFEGQMLPWSEKELDEKFSKLLAGDTLREKCEKQIERCLEEISTRNLSPESVENLVEYVSKLTSVYRTLG